VVVGGCESQPRQDPADSPTTSPLGVIVISCGSFDRVADFTGFYGQGLQLNVPNVRNVPNVPDLGAFSQMQQRADNGNRPVAAKQVRSLRLIGVHNVPYPRLQIGDAVPLE
jgi:hypothetical protein